MQRRTSYAEGSERNSKVRVGFVSLFLSKGGAQSWLCVGDAEKKARVDAANPNSVVNLEGASEGEQPTLLPFIRGQPYAGWEKGTREAVGSGSSRVSKCTTGPACLECRGVGLPESFFFFFAPLPFPRFFS